MGAGVGGDLLAALQQDSTLAIGAALVLGLIVGSFLNVVIYRLPKMLEAGWQDQAAELRGEEIPERERFDLISPRSRCPSCGHSIGALENIPVLSWLFLRGRCKACGTRISARYPAVELASGLLCAGAVGQFGFTLAAAGAIILSLFLLVLALIDLDTQLLPDGMTLPLLWIGLVFNLGGTYAPIEEAVVGAMIGYLSLWSIYWIFRLATGKEGMGYGDFKLLAALGAWFGWHALPSIILLASAVGALVGIALIVFARHKRGTPIPFGPYLAGAGLLALYVREPVAAIFGVS
jgi:leader peptidase (prepilin peptidase)/N-methyltransferase